MGLAAELSPAIVGLECLHACSSVLPNNGNLFTAVETYRVFSRHGGRANTAHVDGYAVAVRTRAIGFQYTNGHPAALWDKE